MSNALNFDRSQVNIFLDENSTNTLGNALNCCKIISDQVRSQNPDIHHIALVTNEFHNMPRAHLFVKTALRNSQVRIHALPAENGLAPGNEYRYRILFYYFKNRQYILDTFVELLKSLHIKSKT